MQHVTGSVVLTKLGTAVKPIVGQLINMPKRGQAVKVKLDNSYDYITTPVIRIFHLLDSELFFFETTNTRYKLRVNR